MKQSPESVLTTIDESRWHWKSVIIYLAALICAVDAPLQSFVMSDLWGTVTSIILFVFLTIESYARLFRSKTYLGRNFALILSILIIVLTASTYFIHFTI